MAPKNSIFVRTCVECQREFDMTVENDTQEWFYGHDCEE